MRVVKAITALSLLLLLSGMAAAQSGGGDRPTRSEAPASNVIPGSIRGRVLMPDGSPVAQPIRVTLSVLRGDQSIIYTDSQGGSR